ncbi:hypothetical protein AM1_1375 [Acaryochloris marina MBIC11017]|uniref:Uncharacterized protein n=1 Tax=Acaryochloris marina (strain MBIC 11017) TaxID=329726 RepID=B0C6I5_ACAM1|nr:hypothetical protein AM1_1375 [Acaryochloris marina MBIC11017]
MDCSIDVAPFLMSNYGIDLDFLIKHTEHYEQRHPHRRPG